MNESWRTEQKKPDEYLCIESITGRFFNSNKYNIEIAVMEMNRAVQHRMIDIPLNSFYMLVGLGPNAIGHILGWEAPERIEVSFHAIAVNDEPVLVADISPLPLRRFYEFGSTTFDSYDLHGV